MTNESISEIKQAETDVVERLTGVNWNVIGKEIMGLTPSQQGSDLHQERASVQGNGRDSIQHHELGELSDGENKIRPSNAQRHGRVSHWTGLQSVSQATTEDTEGESLGKQSPEALRAHSEPSIVSEDTTRQKSMTSNIDMRSPASTRGPRQLDNEGGIELDTESDTEDIGAVGESSRGTCEGDRVENQAYPNT